MKKFEKLVPLTAGLLAGTVNGLLGSGGGMLLVPLLSKCHEYKEEEVFSVSVLVMFTLSVITLLIGAEWQILNYRLLPCYLVGSCIGGIIAGKKPLCVKWLHKLFGIMVMAGGIRCLCD